MPITVTITKPLVFDEYGRLLTIGQQYTPNNDDYARNLIQTLRATDNNGVMLRSRPESGFELLDAIDTVNTSNTTTSQQNLNPNHRLIPAATIGMNDRLRIFLSASKNGTTAAITLRLHLGTTGTIADPVIATILDLATTNVSYGTIMEFKRITPTSIQRQGNGSPGDSFGGANATAFATAVTVPNMDTNGLYFSISSQADVSGEVVSLQDYTLELYSTDS